MPLTRSTVLRLVVPPSIALSAVAVLGLTGACPLCTHLCSAATTTATRLASVVTVQDAPPAAAPTGTPAPQSPKADTPKADTPKADTPKVEAPKDDAKPAPPQAPVLGPMHAKIYKDLDGNLVDLADAAGKPIVMELWATWCGPCRKQRDLMHTLSKEFPEIVFVAASVDEKGAAVVKDYIAKNPERNPADSKVREVMATPELRQLIRARNASNSIPQVITINRKGEIMDVAVGGQSEQFMRAQMKILARQKAPAGKATTPPAGPPAARDETTPKDAGGSSGAPSRTGA
jgi:thiol-disulfide isomerase/thioredoxin